MVANGWLVCCVEVGRSHEGCGAGSDVQLYYGVVETVRDAPPRERDGVSEDGLVVTVNVDCAADLLANSEPARTAG